MSRELIDGYLEKGIFGLILAIFIYSPLAFGGVLETDFAIIEWMAAGVAALWIVRTWTRRGHQILWPPACWTAAAFAAYAVIWHEVAPVEYLARRELLRVIVYGLVFFAILDNLSRQEFAQGFAWTLILIGTGLSLYAIYQFASNSPWVWRTLKPAQYMHRGGGTFICPNHLAGYLEMTLPLGLAFALTSRVSHAAKVFLAYACVAMLGGLGATVSRGGWLSAGLALLAFFIFLTRYRETRAPAAIILALLTVSTVYFAQRVFHPIERTEKEFVDSGIDEIRFALWQPTYFIWREHFWWGGGPGHFEFYFRKFRPPHIQMRPQWAHNDYLNTLADWGLIGGILALGTVALVYVGFFQTWKYIKRTNDLGSRFSNRTAFVLGAGAGLLAILIHSWFDFNLQIPANALAVAGLMAFGAGYMRFGAKPHWVKITWIGKAAGSALLLAAGAYLFSQGWAGYREGRILNYLRDQPQLSPDQAMSLLKRAQAIEPANFETAYRIGELLQWDCQNSQYGAMLAFPEYKNTRGLAAAAARWLERAIELNPLEADAYVRRGLALDAFGQPQRGGECVRKALELDPNNYFILALAGWHFMQTGEFLAAKGCLERSARFNWRNPLAVSLMQQLALKMKRLAPPQIRLLPGKARTPR